MTPFVPPKPLPALYTENQSEARARKLHEQARKDAAWRATLNPMSPLLAAHFRGQGRIAALVLGPAGDATTAGADIRLLSARKLIEHIDRGGRMEIRQALEAAGADVFLDAATVHGLLPELATKDRWGNCTFSGVA